jgi:hypothetical protein
MRDGCHAAYRSERRNAGQKLVFAATIAKHVGSSHNWPKS